MSNFSSATFFLKKRKDEGDLEGPILSPRRKYILNFLVPFGRIAQKVNTKYGGNMFLRIVLVYLNLVYTFLSLLLR